VVRYIIVRVRNIEEPNGLDSVDDDGYMDRVDKSEATSGSAMVKSGVVDSLSTTRCP
jgi:hypothetical protein